jgi:hypothetical protein
MDIQTNETPPIRLLFTKVCEMNFIDENVFEKWFKQTVDANEYAYARP